MKYWNWGPFRIGPFRGTIQYFDWDFRDIAGNHVLHGLCSEGAD